MKIDDRLLTQALINYNNQFVDEFPNQVEVHEFSRSFEKKMRHLISADRTYGGRHWLERMVRYTTKIAVIAICFVMINLVSVKAFDVNIWQVIVTKTEHFVNIHFAQKDKTPQESGSALDGAERMKIQNIPVGYTQQEFYAADNMTVQHLVSESGTITYTESLVTETADVNIAAGVHTAGNVGAYQVDYIRQDDSLTAFFHDDTFYHIVEIQGKDADEDFANKIIEELEEQ